MSAITPAQVLDAIDTWTMVQVNELAEGLQDKYGVAAVAAVAAGPAAARPAEEVEEKTELNVKQTEVGEKKIDVIKAVRQVTALGLKEAKDLVESAPSVVKEAVTKEEAATIKAAIEAAGGKVTVE